MAFSVARKYQPFRWLGPDLTLNLSNAPWLTNVLKIVGYTTPNNAGQNAQSTYTGAYGGLTPGGTLTKLVQNADYLLISGLYNSTWTLPTSIPVVSLLTPGSITQLATPTGVQATASSTTALSVAASSVANASSYKLFSSPTQGGTFSQLATGLSSPAYNHTGLTAFQTVWYKWQAIGDGSTYSDSAQTTAFSGTTQNIPLSVAVDNQRVATVTLPIGEVITDYEYDFVSSVPTEQVAVFGGKTSGVTQNTTTGDVTLASSSDAAYSNLYLNSAPGNYVVWQYPSDPNAKFFKVGLSSAKANGAIVTGPSVDDNYFAANEYRRLCIASNGRDLLFQGSTDNVTYSLIQTFTDYIAYYAIGDHNPITIRVLATNVASTPATIKGLKALGLTNTYVQVVCDGNSLTAGTNSSTFEASQGDVNAGTRKDYPAQLAGLFASNRDYNVLKSYGVSGQTTQDMASDAATQVDVNVNTKFTKNILLAWEITNDFATGATKEQAYDNFKNYCLARKAAGWKVIVGNVLLRTSNLQGRTAQDFIDLQNYVNPKLAAEYTQFADALADLNALNLQNTAGWDGTHPSDAGYLLVAQTFKAAILAI